MKLTIIAAVAATALTAGAACGQPRAEAQETCAPGNAVAFVCGVRNPEDLERIPGTRFIIGTGLAVANQPGSGGLILIDGPARTAVKLPAPTGAARAPFNECETAPDQTFSAHGLSLVVGQGGRHLLFITGHGAREAIEVFDIDASGSGAPAVTWAGCIRAPEGAYLNSVAVNPEGTEIFVTEFYRPPLTMQNALRGENTGGVWRRAVSGGTWTKIPNSDLPGANGIAVTPDGKYVFAAVTGTSAVMRFDLATGAAPTRIDPGMRTDNLRWAPDGRLLLAGPGRDPACTPAEGRPCPQVPAVAALNPQTLAVEFLKAGPAEPDFPGISTAIIVGDEMWMGSYNASRVAVQKLP